MTSVLAATAQIPANKLYVNIAAAQSSITDTNGVALPWVTSVAAGGLSTPGAAILRDMGKNVYGPDPNVPSAVGSQSTIYRKVQLVTTGTNGYYGTGGDATYLTGYISLGGQTYGGGNGQAIGPGGVGRAQPWVRLN
jgi:hypothetical protein